MKISVVSGGFDPIHRGHIKYLKEASSQGDRLIIALNSDEWLANKKGKPFMKFSERKLILESIIYVDEVIDFKDDLKGTCIEGLKKIKKKYPNDEIIFCNGGDRDNSNVPESILENIKFLYGVGGQEKINSSSDLLENWNNNFIENRQWGSFKILFQDGFIKLKELSVLPNKKMSLQRHFQRSELWFISSGSCTVKHGRNTEDLVRLTLNKNDSFLVNSTEWHQIKNDNNEICKIIEIQYGKRTSEEDIERIKK